MCIFLLRDNTLPQFANFFVKHTRKMKKDSHEIHQYRVRERIHIKFNCREIPFTEIKKT